MKFYLYIQTCKHILSYLIRVYLLKIFMVFPNIQNVNLVQSTTRFIIQLYQDMILMNLHMSFFT
jgi:hypothetical protein